MYFCFIVFWILNLPTLVLNHCQSQLEWKLKAFCYRWFQNATHRTTVSSLSKYWGFFVLKDVHYCPSPLKYWSKKKKLKSLEAVNQPSVFFAYLYIFFVLCQSKKKIQMLQKKKTVPKKIRMLQKKQYRDLTFKRSSFTRKCALFFA